VNEADRQRLRGIAQKIWPSAQLVVGSDRDSGFATAFRDGDGISVIAGTGSAVTGRRSGRVEKAGGWGQLLGDRGGGYNLAVQALRFVLSNYDLDHRIDSLGEDVLRRLCLTRLEELVDWAQNADKMSVAMLAPAVFEAARGGHREMREAVQAGAHILAHFTAAVARRLGFEAPCVKLQGSLFLRYAEYGSWFGDYLSEFLPAARTELCRESGALGAAWLASHALKIPSRAETRESAITELANAATEQRNPGSENLDQLLTHELVDLFVREEEHVAQALAAARDSLAGAIELVSTALQNGGRLFYVGAGTSGRLGVLDASEIPPTFGASPELVQGIIAGGATALHSAVEGAEDQRELGALAVAERGVNARDVVCGISASGRTPFVLGALSQARELGARTVLLSCNPARPRAEKWDTEIDLATGAEIVTGSTRLKAGTATKVALNIISTCSMIRFGKVRGNLMVDVKVSNAKLRDRAIRVVRAARKCSYEEAHTLLQENDWNVRATLR
jgi:N-acetylmuramic acid 6-phosphate etherase